MFIVNAVHVHFLFFKLTFLNLHVSSFFQISGNRFQDFLSNLGTILKNSDVQNPTIILDNAPVHNGAFCDDIEIRFLPPYSPFLNPIENVFSTFKLKIRALLREDGTVQRLAAAPQGQSIAEHRMSVLKDLATTTIEDQDTLSGEKVTHMCTHVMQYMHRCFAMADIFS